jgi:hypothetical protein
LLSAALLELAAGLPRQDHVCSTTDKSFLFQNKKIDEMQSKLDATENPDSFEKYPTPPWIMLAGGMLPA